MVLAVERFILQGELLGPLCFTYSGEGWMNKRLASPTASFVALIAIMISGFTLVGSVHFGVTQSSTPVNGIINSDTTWTKANSPYNLTGNVAIDKGVTLTIEPGVTVNLNKYYIRVNGTLTARGTNTDNIYLNAATDGYIEFTASSAGWNSQTGTGCIIENAIINTVLRNDGSSLMINNNTITKGISIGGSSTISKNIIAILSDDPLSTACAIFITNENVAQVVDNTISGSFYRAAIEVGNGSPTIQRNLISNSYGYGGGAGYGQAGIFIYRGASPIIKENTITKNANGISLIEGNSNPTIVNNNIEDNTNYNLYMNLGIQVDIEATNNWWGTTDTAEIDRKIWDYKDDFTLGTVNFVPFLTAPNPQAMPDANSPLPTPSTTPSPTPTPTSSPTPTQSANPSPSPSQNPTTSPTASQTELYGVAVVVLGVVVAVLAVVVVALMRKVSRFKSASVAA